MAINIFSGTRSSGKSKGANSASKTVRAQNAKQALTTPSQTSDSGSTAVGSSNTLSKVGNFIGKAAGIASKFLPGIGGTIASGISSLFNDPEWWQSTPGDPLTLNDPLRFVSEPGTVITELNSGDEVLAVRSTILEFTVQQGYDYDYSDGINSVIRGVQYLPTTYSVARPVITPSAKMITQYIMPHIRKVVNAVPLQNVMFYNTAIQAGATIYAMWRQLRKYDYMCKHGQTYLASMNDEAFPLFKTENAAWLQSTINRLEEYLRANIRLPHTLCEYLAWRFGRVYKSNDSAKAALVLYDYMPLSAGTEYWDSEIAYFMSAVSTSEQVQKANTDLYNTYFDHDYQVEVRDDTQFRFDKKEFMLRLNLTGGQWGDTSETYPTPSQFYPSPVATIVAIDSTLDNPTTFMASTVSATGVEQDGSYEVLFPVNRTAMVYISGYSSLGMAAYDDTDKPLASPASRLFIPYSYFSQVDNEGNIEYVPSAGLMTALQIARGYDDNTTKWSHQWAVTGIPLDVVFDAANAANSNITAALTAVAEKWSKAVDLYNLHSSTVTFTVEDVANYSDIPESAPAHFLDFTSLSIDAGQPNLTTINTEHVYAFANLCDLGRSHSMSYKTAEKQVAKDTANFIEKLDVAVAK